MRDYNAGMIIWKIFVLEISGYYLKYQELFLHLGIPATTAYAEVCNLLEPHMNIMKRLVEELLVNETLSNSEIDAIIEPFLRAAGSR